MAARRNQGWRLLGSDIDVIIVCSMGGDFASIEEEASQRGVEVYCVGFQDGFSLLLMEKNQISLESLECVEERKPKRFPSYSPITADDPSS